MKEYRSREDEFLGILKMLSPGTPLREGLDSVLQSKTGGLIVIGDSDEVMRIADGGFKINCDYSPSYLYELAKMDGAIIISSDLKRILYANTQLIPDPSISTQETGTRHRTAERVAKQTDSVVVSISRRRNTITVYRGGIKYVLMEPPVILAKANQAVQTLEKYKSILDEEMSNLSILEFEDLGTLYDAAIVIQRTGMVLRIVKEVEKYICELGNEGRLISMQLNELINGVGEDGNYLIRDYHKSVDSTAVEETKEAISSLTDDGLMDVLEICKALGYPADISVFDEIIAPRGYRILSRIPRLPLSVIENLIKSFGDFQSILNSSVECLDSVEGIGEVRAKAIKCGLKRMQKQLLLGRHI